jgi:hypothetical protein
MLKLQNFINDFGPLSGCWYLGIVKVSVPLRSNYIFIENLTFAILLVAPICIFPQAEIGIMFKSYHCSG